MDEKKDATTAGADICPECGVDLSTGKMPEPKAGSYDRVGHAVLHWGTDNPATLTNPEARKRAKAVIGTAKRDEGEG